MGTPVPDMRELTDAEKAEIDALSREEMCRLWRFSSGHRYFDSTKPFWAYFNARFTELGGFSSEISKRIGWDG